MPGNTETELLTKLQRSVDDLQRQGADNQKKLDRALRLLDGDDGQSIGLRAEMRDLKQAVRDYDDHEKRIKTLEGESTTQKGSKLGRTQLWGGIAFVIVVLGGLLGIAIQISNLAPKAIGGS